MWIERLHVQGFRGLEGEWEFARGLNLVFGVDEAGKSSMQDALIRALFGFSAAERRRYRGTSVRDECRPWSGQPFGVVVSVRDADGRDFRIEWDFETHAVRLFEGGRDRSAEVRGKSDDVEIGRAHV